MNDPVAELFDEFRRDHQVMGRGLFEIATALKAEDDQKAAEAARALDVVAGPHIRFEELYFYPELRGLLGDSTVDRFESEHREGLAAVLRLSRLEKNAVLTTEERKQSRDQIDTMRVHTDECGEHFGALGRLPKQQQKNLLSALQRLRLAGDRWTERARGRTSE